MKILEGLAHRVARALGTLQLRSELQGFLFDTVKSLVAAVDAKDPYTRGHSERVHYLAVLAGTRMDLDPEQLQSLSWAAILHDIGKISIPRKILCKPSGLTQKEQEIIRTHPERGCAVIRPVPQFANALAGIRHHHEQFDGSGYPDELARFEIPLSARIISVADAFDAITSDRPYFPAHSWQEALQIMDKDTGHFDPNILPVFREIVVGEIASGSLAFGALHHIARDQNAPGNRDDLRLREAA
ncbi:MAG: HD-GYP domain-containing protein [Candidatus Eisenbacteria sp.]|nr:HD-GYP domain-containing protein [Candidatus Eisenbacteria bacterium]